MSEELDSCRFKPPDPGVSAMAGKVLAALGTAALTAWEAGEQHRKALSAGSEKARAGEV